MKKINDELIEKQPPLYKQFLDKFVNIKIIAIVIVVGIIIISLASFVDSVKNLINALPSPKITEASFDIMTQERTLAVAKDIDDLCSRLITNDKLTYDMIKENYRTIDVELRNLLLRQTSRPLNDGSVKQQQILLNNFESLWQHNSHGKVSVTFVKEVRILYNDFFVNILKTESSKPKVK